MKFSRNVIKNETRLIPDKVKRWCYNNIETFDIAVVLSVSKYAERLVDVQPLAVNEDEDGVLVYPATITECPVILQGNLDGVVHFPLTVGTKVLIGYPKESIEEFTYGTTTEQYVPVDTLKWNNRQAFVLGYASQVGQDKTLSTTDFEIQYFDSRLAMTPSNDFSYENPTSSISLDNTGTLNFTNGNVTATFNPDGTFTITGGQGTINGATITTGGNVITASGSDLDQTRADLDAFKAAYEAHGSGAPNHPPPPPF